MFLFRKGGDEHLVLTGCQFQLALERSYAVWQIICQQLPCLVVSMAKDAKQEVQRRNAAAMQAAGLFLAEVQNVERVW